MYDRQILDGIYFYIPTRLVLLVPVQVITIITANDTLFI
jgi:hypothetical protein